MSGSGAAGLGRPGAPGAFRPSAREGRTQVRGRGGMPPLSFPGAKRRGGGTADPTGGETEASGAPRPARGGDLPSADGGATHRIQVLGLRAETVVRVRTARSRGCSEGKSAYCSASASPPLDFRPRQPRRRGGGRTGAGPADSLVVRPRAGPGACQAQRPRRLGRQAPHNTEKGVQRGDRIERADRKLPRKSWRVPSSGRVFLAAGTASAKALRQERHCGAEGKGGQPGVVWPFFRPWDVMQGRDTV